MIKVLYILIGSFYSDIETDFYPPDFAFLSWFDLLSVLEFKEKVKTLFSSLPSRPWTASSLW